MFLKKVTDPDKYSLPKHVMQIIAKNDLDIKLK
ncbi:hypothetical protein FHS10_004708 [Mucilaginibacter dorajii]|nr:hypothetical protein [Mucilaginibacter dorajii]